MPWRTILRFLSLGLVVSALQIHENVIFHKQAEVSLSQTDWKLTLVVDLNVYQNLFHKTLSYISRVEEATWDTAQKHLSDSQAEYAKHFMHLRNEVQLINNITDKIKAKFDSYNSLNTVNDSHNRRFRRGLFNFMGSIYGYFFGLTTEKDLNDIREGVNQISANQQKFKHVLHQSLTILNKSHDEIIQNRERINTLNRGLSNLYLKINKYTRNVKEQYLRLRNFLHFYLDLNSMVNIAQELVMEMIRQFEDLERQVDMLSTGSLTPGIISSNELRQALLEISNQLPNGLNLPIDPLTHLWEFYKAIACATTIIDDKLLIILHIPLVNQADQLEIYEVFNLPLPNLHTKIIIESNNQKQMIATYEIESEIFAR